MFDSHEPSHANPSVFTTDATVAAKVMPEFLERRLAAYRQRKAEQWNNRHIMAGKRPTPSDLVLTSNDYLAIAQHSEIIAAETDALAAQGKGAMMSAIFLQHAEDPQRRLEQILARDLGAQSAVLAQSGWCANVGLLQSIADERTPVYVDHLAHASLWEGIKSAGARAIAVHHNSTEHMERQLLRYGPGVIAIDAVYSTTGSVAPIAEYVALARQHGCVLIVDESHSLGVFGEHGEGMVAGLGLADAVDFVTASLAKAYVGRAGLITCTAAFKEYFVSESLPAIFSSTLLPHDLAGLAAAHAVIRGEPQRRDRVHAISAHVRTELSAAGYPVNNGGKQIIGLEVGLEADTMQVRDILEANGIVGSIFCAPATPAKRALIRLTLNAGLADMEVERLISTLRKVRSQIRPELWSGTRREQRRAPAETIEDRIAA